jgi:hypothetical protein
MEKPREDTSLTAYREHSAFTCAGVAADPEVAGLETALSKEHDALKQQARTLEDQEEEVQKKRSIFLGKDARCDRTVRSFELRLLDLVGKRRNDPLYRRYFPEGLREITEAEPRVVEPALVKAIIATLLDDKTKSDLGPLATEFQPQLESALADVLTAEKALTDAEERARHIDEKAIPEVKARWVDEYVKLHAALRGKLPRDPARVEGFFYPFKKDRKKVADGTGDAPAPAPGGADAATASKPA